MCFSEKRGGVEQSQLAVKFIKEELAGAYAAR